MNAHLDALVAALLFPQLRDSEQLDPISELLRRLEVQRCETSDAFGGNVIVGELCPKGHRREQGQLVGHVDPVDIEAGVGLGIAEILGALDHHIEELAGALHLRQHVVGGAVHDSVEALDAVRREPLAHGAEDRDATADAGLECHVHTAARGSIEDLLAVESEQGLVGGHHVLPALDGAHGQALRHVVAADQLDHDGHVRIVDQAFGVGIESHTA